MQGWVAPLRFQLVPSQNCGATPCGSGGSRGSNANVGHGGVILPGRFLTGRPHLHGGLVTSHHSYLLAGQRHVGQKSVQNVSALGLRQCQRILVLLWRGGKRKKKKEEGRGEMSASVTKRQATSKAGGAASSSRISTSSVKLCKAKPSVKQSSKAALRLVHSTTSHDSLTCNWAWRR